MNQPPLNVDRVQDTARWVAMARALESERKDALFKDPLARKLAGPIGMALVERLSGGPRGTWPVVARTHVIDRLVMEAVRDGADAVLNLAAGLDTRPYRMELPRSLTWVEVDQSDVIAEKEASLRDSSPVCALERVALDLSQADERGRFLAETGRCFHRILAITEGLLCYLPKDGAMGIAKDLLAVPAVFRWIADLPNSAVVRFVEKRTRGAMRGTAKMQFAPDEGPAVFEPLGWNVVSATSILKAAGDLKRLPFPLSLFARLPQKPYGTPGKPWSGVCVLEPGAGARVMAR
jgi:methyltransferase (TIGR00027 family)